MILHGLRLTNFRGVADRKIDFPDQGVVVVCGPNEVGKSSMLEALDLLLTYRDRSTHRDVKSVKPAGADVGAEVEAEISTGPYRFIYRKRFHKKAMTELEIIEPKREQLSGDDAHERVDAMLAETLDTKLWEAQRVLQSASTTAVNLSGCDALSRALDASAGEADVTPAGDESLLIDRVDAEYSKYFTGTGKPTGIWKAAIEGLKVAESETGRWLLAVEEVDERVAQHEKLTAELQTLQASLGPATERHKAASKADEALAALREQLAQARLVAAEKTATATNSAVAHSQRQQLVTEVERRGEALVELQEKLAEAQRLETEAKTAADAARAAAEKSASALDDAQQRFDAARAAAEACVARGTADRLAARVTGIDEMERELDRIAEELAVITLTDTGLAAIEERWAAVRRIEAQLQSDAARIEFTAPADLSITVDGQSRILAAGRSWAHPASAAVVIDVPGVLSVRIDPGASAAKLHTDLVAAQQDLEEALAAAGAADVDGARAMAAQRRALIDGRTTHTAKLDGFCAGEDPAALRTQLAELRASAGETLDEEAVAAELKAADEALRLARTDADATRKAADRAAAALTKASTEMALATDRLKSGDTEFGTVRDQLTSLRATVADDAVAAQASADAGEQVKAEAAVAALSESYEAADPAAIEAELASAATAVEAMMAERDAAKLDLHTLTAELSVIGSEGRQSRLDEAQTLLDRARGEHLRIGERAEAAQLLRNTMLRHRDNTRQRYVQPYRTELERLGRQVFGATFEVDVDTDLTIQTRTLDGCTVPYDSLSGGAKEQLGILARLAGAALVAKEDTVPVVIDDALGFADPERLAKMGEVLNTVGSHGQVIVLTCTPGRYDGVADAEVIELSA